MIIALWLAVAVSLLLSSYAALSVPLAQLAGYRAMSGPWAPDQRRRPLPKVVDLRRSAAARKGWSTRRRSVELPSVPAEAGQGDEIDRVLRQLDAQEAAKQ